MKIILFLIFSTCIFVFSIVSICTAPIINGALKVESWNTLNCKYEEDEYQSINNNYNSLNKESLLETQKKKKDECYRKKAMHSLEYSSLILDIILGFICAFLGLLHYFDIGKPTEKISGLIGLSTGIITFTLTLVYICYSGYIFTNDIAYSYYSGYYSSGTQLLKLNEDGAFAKRIGYQYICLYYKSYEENSVYAKYSDLGNRQYNYEKKRHYLDDNSKYSRCEVYSNIYNNCRSQPYITSPLPSNLFECDYLYLDIKDNGFGNKYLFDKWITTIIFSCLISVSSIGLAIFGFLLFKNSDSSGILNINGPLNSK